MDSGNYTCEYRTIQGAFELIIRSLASSSDPAVFAQKLLKVQLVPQHVVEVASIVGILTSTQRIQPVMIAVLSCIELQPSKFTDFMEVVRDVYPALADVLNENYTAKLPTAAGGTHTAPADVQAPTAVQEDFTQTNESMIHGKFASLLEFVQMKLQKGLGAEKVERELRLFVIRLFNLPESSIPISSDVAVILEAMRNQKLLTYLNVAGLEQVIKHFCEGDSETESKMEQYKKDRSGFELATKIKESDYISKARAKFRDECDKPAFDLPPKKSPAYLTELAVKLDHRVAEHHLDYLQELWKLLSNVLSLPPLYILLDAVIMSSILVVWLIPTDTVPEATERAKRNANFFRMHPILTVTIGDECVYSTTEPTAAKLPLAAADTHSTSSDVQEVVGAKLSSLSLEIPPLHEDEEALLKACEDGRLEEVDRLIQMGVNVNIIKPSDGATALWWACEKGESLIVEELLVAGADPNIQTEQGSTALIRATVNGHHPIVQELLKTGADPNIQNQSGSTALTFASEHGYYHIARDLLKSGADPNIQTKHGETALICASAEGHHDVAVELITARADVNVQNQSGETALILASDKGHHDVAVELITARADVNVRNQNGDTALTLASYGGHHDVAVELIAARADVNVQTGHGETALICASAEGHHDVAVELITARADVNVQNQNGDTALTLASYGGHHDVAVELIAARADVNVQNQNGSTALTLASNRGHHDVVMELITARADVNVQTKTGLTALILAANRGRLEIASDLMQARADVSIQDKDGDSALMVSAYNGYPDIVERLLKMGAEVNILNKDGLTPLQAAIQKHHTEVVRKLLDAGADIDIAEKTTGWTALFFAAKEGEADIMQLLLQRGADLRTVDKKNVTVIEVAQAHGHEEVCRILHDYLQSQRSLQVNAGDADKPPESQLPSLQTTEVSAGDTDKPPESQLPSLQTTEVSAGDTDQPTESDRQQALKDRVISTSNYVKTLFKRLEERLLPSKAEKARAIKEFQTFPSPPRQTSKRAKKGKRQSDKRSKSVDVNIPAVP